MVRPFIWYPKDIELETFAGKISLAVTEKKHISVCSKTKSGGEYLTANRVEYYVSMHLYRQADGSYDLSKTNEISTSRAGSFDNRSITHSALEKIKKAVIPAVNEWAKANLEILEQAEYAHINNKIQQLETHVEKAAKELKTCQDALQQELDKYQDMNLPPCTLPFADIELPQHSFSEGSNVDLLHKIVKSSIPQIFIESHIKLTDPEELKAEALGILVAKFAEWDGILILEIAIHALEDANFRREAEQLRKIIFDLEAKA